MVDRILALHADDRRFAKFDIYVCTECRKTQPCPTIRAVEANTILVRRRDGQGWRDPADGQTYHWISESEAVR
jgi:hypothetical protein